MGPANKIYVAATTQRGRIAGRTKGNTLGNYLESIASQSPSLRISVLQACTNGLDFPERLKESISKTYADQEKAEGLGEEKKKSQSSLVGGGPCYPWALERCGLRWLRITFGERNSIEIVCLSIFLNLFSLWNNHLRWHHGMRRIPGGELVIWTIPVLRERYSNPGNSISYSVSTT